MNNKKIYDKKMVLLLFWLCWIVYFCTYLGRLNYSSAMPQMINAGFITRSQAGLISTLYFTSYAIGQLINGILGDKMSSKWMIFGGVFFSGIANLCMGLIPNFLFMAICWTINGFALSMVWPPIVRIFSEMLVKEVTVKCFTNISSTIAMGTLFSYLLSAFMISKFGWGAVFTSAAIILLILAFVWFKMFGIVEHFQDKYGVEEIVDESVPSCVQQTASVPFIKLVFSPAVLVILLPLVVQGVLKDGVTAWVPTYISETFMTSPVTSVLAATVLPIVNLSGAYAAQYVRKKFFESEIKVSMVFFFIALAALMALFFFSNVSIILTVALLAIITSSMLAINTALVSFVPMHFAKYGRSSTMSGFLNSVAYVGSAVSTVSIGLLVSNAGWSVTILSWGIVTAVALVVCIIGRKKVFS